ncbi:MAG: UDP-glucose 6-dehydrogenase [Candidatus Meridianibacter frigidus]|nr:MAG: UDP-glucose 6-dehydrogenase [Candidatus Eremiobacteraeota bacterium]
MFKVTMFGVGYVGLVTGTCFAELGNRVLCYDTDRQKIGMLNAGEVPFFEPGLAEMIARNAKAGRLRFTDDSRRAVEESDIIVIAVGTPMGHDGHADLRYVRDAAITIAKELNGPKLVVNKSTVPVETGDLVATLINEYRAKDFPVEVVSNPEFVREGSAIADFMSPDRIVLGCSSEKAAETMRHLYAPLDVPVILTDVRTAEMIKYTANAFLATKISFINEIATICERVGADVREVVRGAGSDHRIGTVFFQPGLGFGGSCFPKDVTALHRIAQSRGVTPRLLAAVLEVNDFQLHYSFGKIADHFSGELAGRRIGFLGLAFKPNTDDVRESPALALAELLSAAGAVVQAHDPIARENATAKTGASLHYAADPYEAATGADAIVVATEWNEYKQLDLALLAERMRGSIIFDFRNIYDLREAADAGLTVIGVGRASAVPGRAENRTAGAPVESVL